MSIMIFCAHPDDEAIGPGGTIAKYAKEGKQVIVVIFSQGEASHPIYKAGVIKQIRRREAKLSAKILGVSELIHLNYPDGKLLKTLQHPKVTQEIVTLMRKYKPEKVFTHAQDDLLYADHVGVYRAVMHALDVYEEKPEVYTFQIWSINIRKRNTPQMSVDISDTFMIKQRALAAFKSQKVALFQLWPTVIIKAIMQGLHNNAKFAENFFKIR